MTKPLKNSGIHKDFLIVEEEAETVNYDQNFSEHVKNKSSVERKLAVAMSFRSCNIRWSLLP